MTSKVTSAALAILLAATAAQCDNSAPTERTILEKAVRDEVTSVAADDPTMAAAMSKARSTLPEFLTLAQKPPPGTGRFTVKVAVRDGTKVEYFWIDPFTQTQETFSGEINNTPRSVRNVALGDKITFAKHEIVDWMYMEGSIMQGNYTARALLKNAPEHEREAFRKRYGLDLDF